MGKSKWWSAFSPNVQIKRKSGCNNNSNNNNIIIVIIVCTENSLQSIQSKLPKLSGHSGNSTGSVMECVCVFLFVCVHVASCSYCKSSVQWVKQCSQSHLEALQRSLCVCGRGGSEVRLHQLYCTRWCFVILCHELKLCEDSILK